MWAGIVFAMILSRPTWRGFATHFWVATHRLRNSVLKKKVSLHILNSLRNDIFWRGEGGIFKLGKNPGVYTLPKVSRLPLPPSIPYSFPLAAIMISIIGGEEERMFLGSSSSIPVQAPLELSDLISCGNGTWMMIQEDPSSLSFLPSLPRTCTNFVTRTRRPCQMACSIYIVKDDKII